MYRWKLCSRHQSSRPGLLRFFIFSSNREEKAESMLLKVFCPSLLSVSSVATSCSAVNSDTLSLSLGLMFLVPSSAVNKHRGFLEAFYKQLHSAGFGGVLFLVIFRFKTKSVWVCEKGLRSVIIKMTLSVFVFMLPLV